MVIQRIVKPKTQKGKRAVERRESQIVENPKHAMFLRGSKTSEIVTQALKDLLSLKQPHATMLQHRNEFRPFEDSTPLEDLSKKQDHSLFMFGTHSKKRPHTLIMGRMFDYQVLDMFELGLSDYKALHDFKNQKTTMGSKPCLIFNGGDWDTTQEYQRLKNFLTDFFKGPDAEKVRLIGLEQALTFTLSGGIVHVRNYRILLKKSGSRTPRVELEEIGPSFQFAVRRTKLGSEAMYRDALKVPRVIKPKKVKNISKDKLGSKLGRVHMKKQDLSQLQLRKLKAFKKGRPAKKKPNNTENSSSNTERMDAE